MNAIVPIARTSIAIRPATLDDVPFMDGLQKQYNKQLGHFKTEWFEGYIKTGGVLVAVGAGSRAAGGELASPAGDTSVAPTEGAEHLLGYCISRDRYQKRDELG